MVAEGCQGQGHDQRERQSDEEAPVEEGQSDVSLDKREDEHVIREEPVGDLAESLPGAS